MKVVTTAAVLALLAAANAASAEGRPTDASVDPEFLEKYGYLVEQPEEYDSEFERDLDRMWDGFTSVAGHAWRWARSHSYFIAAAVLVLVWLNSGVKPTRNRYGSL